MDVVLDTVGQQRTDRLVERLVLLPALLAAVGHTVTLGAVGETGLVSAVTDETDPGVGESVALQLAELPAQGGGEGLNSASAKSYSLMLEYQSPIW